MVQSLDRTQADSPIPPPSSSGSSQGVTGIPAIGGHHGGHHGVKKVAIMPRTTPHYSSAHHRLVRQGAYVSRSNGASTGAVSLGALHPDQKQYAWASAKHKHLNQMLAYNGRSPSTNNGDMNGCGPGGGPHSPNMNGGPVNPIRPMILPLQQSHYGLPLNSQPGQGQCLSPASTTSTGSGTSAAASFFARAAQKLNISSRKKRKHHGQDSHESPFPTNFCDIIYNHPPPAPPVLLRNVGRPQNPGTGKVKVMLRICPVDGNQTGSFLSLDARKKQVTVYDPSINGYTTAAHRQRGVVAAPKMFAFDTIFSQDDSLSEMCATGLTEIIQAVVSGADGCLFCYGHARLGKTYTMIGVDDNPQNLGVIPCAIAWLFKLINEQKEKTGARFSVRVSAVEVTGKQEQLKDLLGDVANDKHSAAGMEAGSGTAPGVYLREDPICGTQLENQSELRAPTADRAAYYLDAAVAARTVPEVEEDARNSHLLFTLHVYQYRVEKSRGNNGVAGGRSRLHLVDLGSCSKSKEGYALSLSALGNVILALLNGQRHVPHRESKLTQLMRESLGNLSCRTGMIAHVSPAVHAYNETLQVIQLAAKIHRMKRRRINKFSSTSSESGSSCDESGRLRPRMRVGIRMGTLREDAMSMSDPDYTSSSEQSCDTVIYCGPNGQALSDRELTDNEGPPRMVPVMPRMGRSSTLRTSGSRSSGDESSTYGDMRLGKPPVPKCGTIANSRLPMKSGRQTPTGLSVGASRSAAGSPVPGVVQLPRKINIKGKQQTINGHDPSLRTTWSKGPYREQTNGTEQWVDGPIALPYQQQGQADGGERWVDGPDSKRVYQPPPLQPMPSSEQWIDGPNLRPPPPAPPAQWVDQNHRYQGTTQVQAASTAVVRNLNGNNEHWVDGPAVVPPQTTAPPITNSQPVPASEQWVDGPVEFQVDSTIDPRSTPKPERPNKMWTEMAKPSPLPPGQKPAPPPRTQSLKQEQSSSSSAPASVAGIPTMANNRQFISQVVSEAPKPVLPLRNPVLAQVVTEGPRPLSQVSTGSSGTSLLAQVSQTDSRSISLQSAEAVNGDSSSQSDIPRIPTATEAHTLPGANVKSFVRDWVEKHSMVTDSDTMDQQSQQQRTIAVGQVQSKAGPMSLSDVLYGNGMVSSDPGSQPGSAVSSPRVKKRLRKGSLPPPIDHPHRRTAAWIVSVQNATTETETDMVISPDQPVPGECLAPECDQDLLLKTSAPPTYEACMMVQEGQQQGEVEGEEVVVVDQECQVSIHTAENEEEEAAQGGKVLCWADEMRSEQNSDLGQAAAATMANGMDISNLLISNRESIYELQMDETLECSRGADGSWPNTFTSEDDQSSSASLNQKNEDVCELYGMVQEVDDVEIPSPSHYDEGVVGDLLVNMENVGNAVEVTKSDSNMSPLSVNADNESGIASSNGEHLSPPSSSSDSDKQSPDKKITRPTCLRRPDGASNPNLSLVVETENPFSEQEVISEKSLSSPEPLPNPVLTDSSPSDASKGSEGLQSPVRSEGVGQGKSPEILAHCVSIKEPPQPSQDTPTSPQTRTSSKLPVKSCLGTKPPVSSKTSSKPSILPKPSSKKSPSTPSPSTKSPKSETSSSRSPFRFGSKSKTKTPTAKATSPKSGESSPTKSISSVSSALQSKANKEKTNKLSQKASSPGSLLGSTISRPSSVKSMPSTVQSVTSRLTSSLSKLPTSSKSKDKTSPTKGSSKSTSKIPSPGKKESKLPLSKVSNSRVSELNGAGGRATDSDSGNDSGIIVRNDKKKKLLSPYSTITKPRNSTHSSSGHGSDNSSTFSAQLVPAANTKPGKGEAGHHSSGYESMLRDSEATGSSSTQDSTSEGSCSGRMRGPKIFKKKAQGGTRRSRSAPPRTTTEESGESPAVVVRHQSPATPRRQPSSSSQPPPAPLSPSPRAWIDTRQLARVNNEPIEITMYDVHDVERMQRRRKEDAEMRALEKRRARVRELLSKQQHLKLELAEAKDMLMIDRNTWSYDLYVAEQMDHDDANQLEALEKETSILEKRVEACKSRIMMVTCFGMGV